MTEWVMYHFHGATDHDDPTKYENQVRQTGKFTASVWALHLNVPTFLVERTLDLLDDHVQALWAQDTLPYEYSTGGSWADWNEPARESSDNRLVVYFRASQAITARVIGRGLAEVALDRYGGQEYVITTAGDHKTVTKDTRKRGGSDAPATEAEGEPGE